MDQQTINVMVGIASFLGGWWLKVIWEAIKDLQKADEAMAKELSNLNVLVAGQYVRQEQFERFSAAVFSKLDRIEQKVDNKADKE